MLLKTIISIFSSNWQVGQKECGPPFSEAKQYHMEVADCIPEIPLLRFICVNGRGK